MPSTRPPRAVLIRKLVGLSKARVSAFIRWWVALVSGTWRERISAAARASSMLRFRTPLGKSILVARYGSQVATLNLHALARSKTARAILPKPMVTNVIWREASIGLGGVLLQESRLSWPS